MKKEEGTTTAEDAGTRPLPIAHLSSTAKEKTQMTRLSTKTRSSRCQLYILFIPLVLLAGCASTQPQPRSFFLVEQELETHGRKTWFDRLFEADPGGVSFVIAGDYQERPPRKIAVLSFVDEGTGSYLIDKVPVKTPDKGELNR